MQKYKGFWGYFEQLYGNKMDNLEEMDRLLEIFNFPRLNQEEIESMNWNQNCDQNFLKNKSPGPDGFRGKFYQIYGGELMPLLLKHFQKFQRKKCFQTHSMRPPSPWY